MHPTLQPQSLLNPRPLHLSCADLAALQLASLGTAATWRLGKWEELEGYLKAVEQGAPPAALDPAARWEVRQGGIGPLSVGLALCIFCWLKLQQPAVVTCAPQQAC